MNPISTLREALDAMTRRDVTEIVRWEALAIFLEGMAVELGCHMNRPFNTITTPSLSCAVNGRHECSCGKEETLKQ